MVNVRTVKSAATKVTPVSAAGTSKWAGRVARSIHPQRSKAPSPKLVADVSSLFLSPSRLPTNDFFPDDVWWNIGEPDDGCQILVMSPVGQDVAGANCGNVVLAQKNAGCYYTHLDSTFMTQYCCGSGDCAKAGVGGAKRSVTDVPELLARAAAGEDTFAVPINHGSAHQPIATFSLHDKHAKRAAENLESSPGLSLSARAARYAADVELRRRDDDICGPATNVGDSYTKAIGQIQVTDVLTCNSNSACNQQVGKQVTVSHTLTSQTTKTFQVSAGVDVAVEAGIAFFVEAKSTVTGHSDFAWGVIRSTGVSDTESETKTINQVYSQVPGTKGYIWFTPTLECQKKSMVCKGEELVVEQCDPALLQDGSQKGEMGFTTTG